MRRIDFSRFIGALFIVLSLGASATYAEEYGKKKTVEISGQASLAYAKYTNPRLSSESFYLGIQPTISYFFADTWYVGTGIQANIAYSSNYGAWSYYGDMSLLGGKTLDIRTDFKFFGQLAFGTSLPYVSNNGGLESRYYFFKPAIGIKYIVQNVVLTAGLSYTWLNNKYGFDTEYYAAHNIQLAIGIGFYF